MLKISTRPNALTSCLTVLLKIGGVWPVWNGSFKRNVVLNTFLVFYTVLLTLLAMADYVFSSYPLITTISQEKTSVISVVRGLCEIALRVSILHLAVFRYKILKNQRSRLGVLCTNGKSMCSVVLFLLLQKGCETAFTANVLYRSFSNFAQFYQFNKDSSITGSTFETIIALLSKFPNWMYMIYTPAVLILAHCLEVKDYILLLENEVKENIRSAEMYHAGHKHLTLLKERYFAARDLADTVDEVFRYYILIATVTIGLNTFSNIFYMSVLMCMYGKFVYPLVLGAGFLFFLILCHSGAVMTEAVSMFEL